MPFLHSIYAVLWLFHADVLNLDQLKDNLELTNEILRDGIRIYG